MKSRLKRYCNAILRAENRLRKWPCPNYHINEEPYFLFIITPPYTGSTALAQILNTAHNTAFLQEKGEGQWLIPGMRTSDRWERSKPVNWESVRSVWLKRVEFLKTLVQNVDIIIEKSPPNLVRIDQLAKTFRRCSVIAFNRNPYANCSSILYRHHNADDMKERERVQIVSHIAEKWLYRSSWIKKWIIDWNLKHFTYEKFCTKPENCVSEIAEEIPSLKSVNVKKKIKVKDYKLQGIKNYNPDQMSKLSDIEIETISKRLNKNHRLVEFFGYDVL